MTKAHPVSQFDLWSNIKYCINCLLLTTLLASTEACLVDGFSDSYENLNGSAGCLQFSEGKPEQTLKVKNERSQPF